MCPSRPTPEIVGFLAVSMRGSGRRSAVWRHHPAASSHVNRSRPRYRRGARGTALVQRWTSRPPSSRSSATWTPDCALPTTRTAPGRSTSARRYAAAGKQSMPAGRPAANPGRMGTAWAPDATMTARAEMVPAGSSAAPSSPAPSSPVAPTIKVNRRPSLRTDATVTRSRTGSACLAAYPSRRATQASRSWKPSSGPASGAPAGGSSGIRFIQPGVLSANPSQRWDRHVSPMRRRSRTTCSIPRRARWRLAASPACPPPITTASRASAAPRVGVVSRARRTVRSSLMARSVLPPWPATA